MKRWIPILLIPILLLCGCSDRNPPSDTVTFYYQRSEITYGSPDSVIVPEEREIYEDEPDLLYLFTLYLNGPLSDTLTLSLPKGTRLTAIRQDGNTLTVSFSPELSTLDGMDLTLACACISHTCYSLTDAEVVRIKAPAVDYGAPTSFTTTRNTFLLFDDTTTPPDADNAS